MGYFLKHRPSFSLRIIALISLFPLSCMKGPLHASALDKMFNSLGASAHLSTPGAYHDQAAGYYTGGGFVMRQRNQTYQPIQISLPHLGAGCGGIDAYFGGFSFMRGDQLVKMLKSMASQAPTYAMQLGLKTMSPTIENLLSQLRKKLMDINAMMMEDCRLVQQIFAAAAPKGSAFEEHACHDVKSQGEGSDWFNAKEICKNPQDRQTATQAMKQNSPDLMVGAFNLVWHVLSKMPGVLNDEALKTFIQSAVGTVVSRKEGDGFLISFKEGKADDKTFLSSWLRGGEAEFLQCDETQKCLNPTWVKKTLTTKESMRSKVTLTIDTIRQKYLGSQVLSSEEKMFLGDTVSLPVYRYIQVSAAMGSSFLLTDAADYIAVSLLLHQFDKMASAVLAAIEDLQKIQMEDTHVVAFKERLQQTRLRIQGLLSTANSGAVWRLTQMIQAHEKTLLSRED